MDYYGDSAYVDDNQNIYNFLTPYYIYISSTCSPDENSYSWIAIGNSNNPNIKILS
ncbi:hypothetical protein MJ1_0388 [Nanobdella aerobiophila]|uniref:Uncharacterized protein n=1 Tax=Nanobdella aerobiophila TaxID=2586965 RepID=A0A915WST8_9ARCH|nr:hypothetical protein [Nanobdella aerobiophila]BBL45552.1 hypothetical protein MJ1_0388 [Nanobdella aerobiophila]